jgi:acyl-CoA synthetase (AMP-forming)/AMP-acid ligase II
MENLVVILRARAALEPDRLAFRFLSERRGDEQTLTYRELHTKAAAIAAELHGRRAAGERALLIYPPGIDYVAAFFGCLYAGVIAVPAYPPTARTLPRLLAIVGDSGAAFGLTTTAIRTLIPDLGPRTPEQGGLRWLTTDDLDAAQATEWREPHITQETIAFLQYTSGSTGNPKGVVLTHGNLVSNERSIQLRFEHDHDSSCVSWLPPYHDMGLIGSILQPICLGFPTTMMAPTTFVRRPLRWLQAIAEYHATTAGAPNFGYELCVERVAPADVVDLDLRNWTVAFVGAEPTRAETLDRFATLLAPCGFRREAFYPCYGLAESTLFVLGGRKHEAPVVRSFRGTELESGRAVCTNTDTTNARTLVSAGRLGLGEHVEIVDPDTCEVCPPGHIGEIWVQGRSVANGYWGRAELSKETFAANTAEGSGPFLRTGDLGFVDDGELFIAGRRKDVIIIDGLNHYPQDIEATAADSHAALRRGAIAAFALSAGPEQCGAGLRARDVGLAP